MSDDKKCPQCNKPLSSRTPDGLCPKCLMRMALQSDTLVSVAADGVDATTQLSNESGHQLDVTMSRGEAGVVSTHEYPSGTRIGSYTLDRKLGEGGMGVVYEAFDNKTKRRIALKILKHTLNTPDARKRFLREGRTAASINHPNSVYVYGTDNLNGKLIISMELVGDGNLQDVIRNEGPMAYRRAVDVILQVIDGLEAAARVGVLHRDVKPSNCFVDAEGNTKVGDFGLSISTQAMEDSLITGENTLLGTPAFSSPEQLRGDDLDSRSDIYSVGVTLFYLLTGNVPFTANSMVQLLSVVLERTAPSVRESREDIPHGLADVIQRCLAKAPETRWKDYEQLRNALLPFSSEAPIAAPLPKRFLAWLVDGIPLQALGMALGFSIMEAETPIRGLVITAAHVCYILYYSTCESWKGTTLGKALLGLRVEDTERNIPSWKRAALRSAIFILMPVLVTLPANLFLPVSVFGTLWGPAIGFSVFILWALMFCTARRSNGFLGVHGLLSGTRVVEKRVAVMQRIKPKQTVEQTPTLDENTTIGPYHVLQSLGDSGNATTSLAYDSRLLRRVWIREGEVTPEIPAVRRQLNRVGRLRWLNGYRNGKTGWDAFEASEGSPLSKLIEEPQDWQTVRTWLIDLTSELHAGTNDGSLPAFVGVENLWIAADGRLKLLDFAAPGCNGLAVPPEKDGSQPQRFDSQAPNFVQEFVSHVANVTLLHGDRSSRHVLPHHATEFLVTLGSPNTSITPVQLLTKLRELCRLPAKLTRTKKWLMFLLPLAFPLLMFAMYMAMGTFMEIGLRQNPVMALSIELDRLKFAGQYMDDSTLESLEIFIAERFGDFVHDESRWQDAITLRAFNQPGRFELRELIERTVRKRSGANREAREIARNRWQGHPSLLKGPVTTSTPNGRVATQLRNLAEELRQGERSRLQRVYIADKFGDLVRDEQKWNEPAMQWSLRPASKRKQAEDIVANYSNATAVEKQRAQIAHDQNDMFSNNPITNGNPMFAAAMAAYAFLFIFGLPAIVSGLLFRGGLLMQIFQVVAVRRSGKRAFRLQMFWRGVLWTLPAMGIAVGAAVLGMSSSFAGLPNKQDFARIGVVCVFFSTLIPVASIILLRRGLLDRLSGTYLVPR